jgi:hypothetical protein
MGKLFAWTDSVDPRRVALWLSILTAIAGAAVSGQLPIADMFGAAAAPFIIAWSKGIVVVAPILVATHSGQDLFSQARVKAVLSYFLLAGVVAYVMAALLIVPANAAQKIMPKETVRVQLTPEAIAKEIQASAVPDLTYAIALASAAGTLQSKVRSECYTAILGAISPPGAAKLGAPPSPDLVTKVEQLAELVDALQPTSPVFVNCAGAAQLANLSVLSFINAVVTGAAGIAVLAPK